MKIFFLKLLKISVLVIISLSVVSSCNSDEVEKNKTMYMRPLLLSEKENDLLNFVGFDSKIIEYFVDEKKVNYFELNTIIYDKGKEPVNITMFSGSISKEGKFFIDLKPNNDKMTINFSGGSYETESPLLEGDVSSLSTFLSGEVPIVVNEKIPIFLMRQKKELSEISSFDLKDAMKNPQLIENNDADRTVAVYAKFFIKNY